MTAYGCERVCVFVCVCLKNFQRIIMHCWAILSDDGWFRAFALHRSFDLIQFFLTHRHNLAIWFGIFFPLLLALSNFTRVPKRPTVIFRLCLCHIANLCKHFCYSFSQPLYTTHTYTPPRTTTKHDFCWHKISY